MRKTLLMAALALTAGLGAQAQRSGDELFNVTPAERRVLNDAGLLSLRVWSELPNTVAYAGHLPSAARVIGGTELRGVLSVLLEMPLASDEAQAAVVAALRGGGWEPLAEDANRAPQVFRETRELPVFYYHAVSLCRPGHPMLSVVATPAHAPPSPRSEVSIRQSGVCPVLPPQGAAPPTPERRAADVLPTLQLPPGLTVRGGQTHDNRSTGEYTARYEAQGDTTLPALWEHLRPQLAAQGWSWPGDPQPGVNGLGVSLRRDASGDTARIFLLRNDAGGLSLEFRLLPPQP